MKILSFIACVLLAAFPQNSVDDVIIELPITFVDGFGSLIPGFGRLPKEMKSDNPWYKTERDVTGIPKTWTKVNKAMIWFNARQFAYQNYKQGNLSEAFFKELITEWKIDLSNTSYSEKPIQCFVYVIYGKDKQGKFKYKLDTNSNLNFADDLEITPPKHDWDKIDSLAEFASVEVEYEAFRNGKVVKRSAPVLVVENAGALWENIPQYAVADLNRTRLLISSSDFNSTDYESVAICEMTQNKVSVEKSIKKGQFITIGMATYQNLGVNLDKQVLRLKKVEDVKYSGQVGYYAKPFVANDFVSQQKISLDSYKGKFLFLEFWGSWCGPCVEDIPELKDAYDKVDKSRVDFLGVARDEAEPLKKMLEKKDIRWKQILCKEEDDPLLKDYGVTGYPASFLIDPTGKIVAKGLRGKNLLDSINFYLEKSKLNKQ